MPIEILTTLLLVLISFLISLYGSLVGFGGGIFMVPILITFFGFDFGTAVGTTMASLIPSAFISTFLNRKNKNVDFKMGTLLEIPTMVGVIFGSLLISFVPIVSLKLVFVVVIFILGLSFFIKFGSGSGNLDIFNRLNKLKPSFIIKNKTHSVAYRAGLYMLLFFGLLSGTLAGLFGMGGGFMKTPIMIKVFKIPAKIATATALFMIMITSITGSVSHYLQGHIHPDKALPVIIGFALGALVGHRVNTHIKSDRLEKLIGVALILASMTMLSNLLFS